MPHVNGAIKVLLTVFLLVSVSARGQVPALVDLEVRLKGMDPLVDSVLNDGDLYRVQIRYALVEDTGAHRLLEVGSFGDSTYFYPASTVKLPVALLTLEKLKRERLTLDDYLVFTSDAPCGNNRFVENSRKEILTFRRMLSEMMVVSDNDHYSALFHFLGTDAIHRRLEELGYTGARIYKAFNGCEWQCHYVSAPCRVVRNGKEVFCQAPLTGDTTFLSKQFCYDPKKLLGSKHEAYREIVEGPFDFNYSLELPLDELHRMMMSFCLGSDPQSGTSWDIREEDAAFLKQSMIAAPRTLENPKYHDTNRYPDNLYKYLLVGEGPVPGVVSMSKIGLSYGFTTETAYLRTKQGVGAFVSVSMYTNANDTVNDGIYEYETLARPFLSRLARILLKEFIP